MLTSTKHHGLVTVLVLIRFERKDCSDPNLKNFWLTGLAKRWVGSGANFIPDSEIGLGGSKGVDGLSAARSDSLMRH